MDTIFALASGHGRAGISVIRISGPGAWDAVRALAGTVPPPRRASRRALRRDGEILDEAIVIAFAAGHSFTGEESAELQVHGSVAVVRAVLAALGGMAGLRPAEPGEFTRRALENGRLDLAQIEGLADLIDAETEAQRRQAMKVLGGAVGARANAWRHDLVRAAALVEAGIDFAEEEIGELMPEVRRLIAKVAGELQRELAGYGAAERVRDGFEVAIIGVPNAGKSTLLNAIAGREAAITSDEAGTTRDVIEVRMDLGGLPVTLLDTAGLREPSGRVEAIGIGRAMERAVAADLRVFLLSGDETLPVAAQPGDIMVRGKADLGGGGPGLPVSGKTGAGIAELLDRIGRELGGRAASPSTITRERHRLAVDRGLAELMAATEILGGDRVGPELVAEHVRAALRALDSLVGRVDVEDLLDEIFASFCIGK